MIVKMRRSNHYELIDFDSTHCHMENMRSRQKSCFALLHYAKYIAE